MRWIHTSILICGIIVVWSAANIMWSGQHYKGIIKADGKGYYAHLPALFIYHDLNFGFFDSIEGGKFANDNYFYDYRKYEGGQTINKYYSGTALAMLPFFGLGHGISYVTGGDLDGYSKWYQISISLAGIAYFLATLYIMALAMRKLGYGDRLIALITPAIVFGTNWYYYVVSEPAMSHVYSIFFISLFVYYSIKWAQGRGLKMPKMALLLGIIILIRPVNGLVVLTLPIFFHSIKDFLTACKTEIKKTSTLLISVVLTLAVVCIQLLIYKTQTGHYWIYSYENEGFNFTHPEILNILFSYKKGLMLYTPLFLLAVVGFMHIYRRNKWQGASLASFMIILTYVLSSWWNWYYGGSFSSRVYIEYYIFFFWALLAVMDGLKHKKVWKTLATTYIVLCICLCQVQTFQYRHLIIHWDGMTKESYWGNFLKIERDTDPVNSVGDE